MNGGVTARMLPALLLLLAGGPAGTGCASAARRRSPPVAPAPERAAAVNPTNHVNAGPRTNKTPRLAVDPTRVADLQTREIIQLQESDGTGVFRRHTRFTDWLDRWHDRLYRKMDNAVRRVDTMWLTEEAQPYDYKLSTFKLRLLARYGGRSQDGNSDFKVKFRADMALPGLGNKLHLYVSNLEQNTLPGEDPTTVDADFRMGLRALLKTVRHNPLDLGAGVRMRSWKPVPYAEVEWRGERPLGPGRIRLTPRVFWEHNDGYGQKVKLAWLWPVSKRKYLQLLTAERSTETTGGFELEETFRFAWLRSGLKRGWVLQASAFPHYKQSDWVWDDFLLNMTWRGAFYRKWIYYTVTPQLQFPQEDDYEFRPSIRVGLEILFGGDLADMI